MGFWSWIGRVAGLSDPPAQRFDVDGPPAGPIDAVFLDLFANRLSVNRTTALSVSTVKRGRNLLCSIATLPLQQLDGQNRVQRSPLLEQIDPNVPNVVTLAMTVEDLIFDAVSWWRVTSRLADGYPATARRLDPDTVTIDPPESGRSPATLPSGLDPTGPRVRVDGEVVPWRDLIRFDSPNPGLLTTGSLAVKRALLLARTSTMYADEPHAREYFAPRDAVDPDNDAVIEEFVQTWVAARKRGATGYVPAAYELHTLDRMSPADLQLAELMKSANLDIANELGIDPEDLGISTTSRTYQNAVDRRRDRINDVLAFYMTAITHRLGMGDVTRRGHITVFRLDDYMKANPVERWTVYEKAKAMDAITVDEIRAAEQWAPLPAGVSGTDGEQDATVTPLPQRGVAAAGRAGHRFHTFNNGPNAPENHMHLEFAATAGQTFTVDTEKRTITGLAVPYGVVSGGYRNFRFRRGSLKYADVSRVKHYKDHYQPVGKALELTDTDAGLIAKLSVAAGPTGDELLTLAAEGVYDGLSIGVDFSSNPDDGDVTHGSDGVYDVERATLREISTTPMPAFDDARVTKVAASRHHPGGMIMDKCATCGHEHAPSVACSTTTPPTAVPAAATGATGPGVAAGFTAEQIQAFSSLATMLGWPGQLPAAPPEGPTIVNPTTLTASTSVTEPAPYRFDRKGNLTKGSHDFSTDLFAGHNGDVAALERATTFVRAQFDVATGDVNELNPTRNRPEMYVDQRDYRYPVWNAISKGTLGDITPFTFPKFNSASGLVSNHTEGVEPSSGTLTVTGQTVTPTAVSGKAKITREVWDQGGNPQLSGLIWRQMVKAWFEALEAFAVATLDAASPTAITLTTAAADAALVDELTSKLALLQFVRGGYSMDNAFTQVDLYKALEAASDTTGRKLLPVLGATNAVGTTRERFTALDVAGTAFLPAWALAASGTVAASSYLFDSESVHGWASAPQRLDFNIEVAHVYIGLWGYKAAAISDLAGVREITYDPAA